MGTGDGGDIETTITHKVRGSLVGAVRDTTETNLLDLIRLMRRLSCHHASTRTGGRGLRIHWLILWRAFWLRYSDSVLLASRLDTFVWIPDFYSNDCYDGLLVCL